MIEGKKCKCGESVYALSLMDETAEIPEELKDIFANSTHLITFTGAGLSAESGIPTYRGAGGLWTKYDPGIYANINYFLENPSYYW